MSITNDDSVLLVGAGASASFNIPLGGEMLSEIAKQLTIESQYLGAKAAGPIRDLGSVGQSFHDATKFEKIPIHASILLRPGVLRDRSFIPYVIDQELSKLAEFGVRLEGQTSESIDDFIVQNPSFSEFAKISTAAVIFQRLYEFRVTDRSWVLRPLDNRDTKGMFEDQDDHRSDRNWIHHLINIVRNQVQNRNALSEISKVKLITFNYDTIIERVLRAQFNNTEYEYGDFADFFELLHVHGAIGDLDSSLTGSQHALIRSWASGIHVVRETDVPSDVLDARERARQLLGAAAHVYSVGFSFARANLNLLGLSAARRKPLLISYCNYNRSVGLRMNAEVLRTIGGKIELNENSNDDDRPLSAADWFGTGYAGELPY